MKPMKDQLGVSPSKGNQGTTRDEEKILFYTSELILCSTICVHSATQHNIQFES